MQMRDVQDFILSPAVGIKSVKIDFNSASDLSLKCFSVLIASMIWLYFPLKCSRKSFSNFPISLVCTLSKKPLTPAYKMQTYSSAGMGTYCFCFNNSVNFSPLFSKCWVEASRSDPNYAKAATSLYWASSSFKEPATYFIALI